MYGNSRCRHRRFTPLPLDGVADRAHGVDALPGPLVEFPVAVALAGEDRAGVAAAHGDQHVRGFDGIGGEHLGISAEMPVPTSHMASTAGLIWSAGRAGRASLNPVAREAGEERGGRLGAVSVVDAGKQHRRRLATWRQVTLCAFCGPCARVPSVLQ